MDSPHPSSVRPQLGKTSSETYGSIFFKLNADPFVKVGLKICTNGHVSNSKDGRHAHIW